MIDISYFVVGDDKYVAIFNVVVRLCIHECLPPNLYTSNCIENACRKQLKDLPKVYDSTLKTEIVEDCRRELRCRIWPLRDALGI